MDKFVKEIKKKYGNDTLIDASFIRDNPKQVFSISPYIDIGLSGGIPEGSWVIVSGDEKCGKTTLALHTAAKFQQAGRKVFYLNIEGRLKAMNLTGIQGLDADEMEVVQSQEGKILSGEDFVNIGASILKNHPRCLLIVDSISALCSENELTSDISGQTRVLGPRIMAAFCRQMASVVPIQNSVVIGISHLIANTSGYGKSKMEDGGRKIKYQGDVHLRAKKIERWMAKDKQIGQIVNWEVVYSALGIPGSTISNYIRYGYGIDEPTETIHLGADFGLINVAGAWYDICSLSEHTDNPAVQAMIEAKPDNTFKFQGQENTRNFLLDNPEIMQLLQQDMHKMLI